MSVDDLIVVRDFEPEDGSDYSCPSLWSTTLVFAMSSERIADAYVIDDLWSPAFETAGLQDGTMDGSKPDTEFDGMMEVSGEIRLTARFRDGAWHGGLYEDDVEHGTFALEPE